MTIWFPLLMFAAMTRASEKWRSIGGDRLRAARDGAGQKGTGRAVTKRQTDSSKARNRKYAPPNNPEQIRDLTQKFHDGILLRGLRSPPLRRCYALVYRKIPRTAAWRGFPNWFFGLSGLARRGNERRYRGAIGGRRVASLNKNTRPKAHDGTVPSSVPVRLTVNADIGEMQPGQRVAPRSLSYVGQGKIDCG